MILPKFDLHEQMLCICLEKRKKNLQRDKMGGIFSNVKKKGGSIQNYKR